MKESLQDWPRQQIKDALAKEGWWLSKVARDLGYKRDNKAAAVFRDSMPRVEQRIAEIVGVPKQEIWPSHYDEHGNKRPPARRTSRQAAS